MNEDKLKKEVRTSRRSYSTRKRALSMGADYIRCIGVDCQGEMKHKIEFAVKSFKYKGKTRYKYRLKCKDCEAKEFLTRKKSKAKARRDRERYNKKYPQKYKARQGLQNALRKGEIEKENCLICGSNLRVAGHHFSYAEEHHAHVIWLCQLCHNKLHNDKLDDDAVLKINEEMDKYDV